MAEGFETAGLFTYDASQSTQVATASDAVNTTKKLFGTSSSQFTYTLAQSQANVTYKAVTPTIQVNHDKVMGLHVYGDLSGNELQLQFTSVTDVRYVKLCDMNFFGWEYVEAKLLSLAESTNFQLTGFNVIRKGGVFVFKR